MFRTYSRQTNKHILVHIIWPSSSHWIHPPHPKPIKARQLLDTITLYISTILCFINRNGYAEEEAVGYPFTGHIRGAEWSKTVAKGSQLLQKVHHILYQIRMCAFVLFCPSCSSHLTNNSQWLTETYLPIPCCLCLRTMKMNWQKEWGDKSTSISDFDYIFCPFSEVNLLFWRLQCSSWSSETSILTWRPSSGAESLLRMNWWDWYSNCEKTTQVNLNMSCWKYKLWGKRKKTEWICLSPSWKNNTPVVYHWRCKGSHASYSCQYLNWSKKPKPTYQYHPQESHRQPSQSADEHIQPSVNT